MFSQMTTIQAQHSPAAAAAAADTVYMMLRMPEDPSTRQKVALLLEKMKACQACAKIAASLTAENFLNDFDDADRAERRRGDAKALCLVLQECVRVPIMTEEDSEQQDLLLSFEDEIMALIVSLVPEEAEIETFIEATLNQQTQSEQESRIEARYEKLDQIFQEQMQQLLTSTNIVNRKIIERFNEIKQRLQKITSQRQGVHGDIQTILDRLTQAVQQASQTLMAQAATVEALGTRLKREETVFSRLIIECEQVLGRG